MWVHNVTCYLSVKQLVKANACPLLVEALRRNTPGAQVSEPIVHRAQWSIPHGVLVVCLMHRTGSVRSLHSPGTRIIAVSTAY